MMQNALAYADDHADINDEESVRKAVMHPTDQQILDTFARRIRQRYPEARVWAFGSRARGEATWESDLDVCVVLDQRITRALKDWIGDQAWAVGFEADRIVTTVVFEQHAFEEGPQSMSPLVSNILREGVSA